MDVVNHYYNHATGTLDQPQKLHQSCPAPQRISFRFNNCRVGSQPGAHRKGTNERPGDPKVHPYLRLSTANRYAYQPGMTPQECIDQGALANPSWTAHMDDPQSVQGCAASLFGEGGQLANPVDEAGLPLHQYRPLSHRTSP
jgi:hypothetical protein